jgi:hypothetical protein
MLLASLVGCHSSSTSPLDAAALSDSAGSTTDSSQVDSDGSQVDLAGSKVDQPDATGAPVCGGGRTGGTWAGWVLPEPSGRKFDINLGEVAVDPGTGLMWQRRPASEQLEWEAAKEYCDCLVLAGHEDWRLPTRIELVSLVDYRRQEPSIDVEAFPETPSTWYWSSSVVAGESAVAWYLSFMDGNTHEAAREMTYGVRCVRGRVPVRAPYQLSGGTVIDPNTHLTWQQALDGQVRTWDQATAYCAALPFAGGGWRLPTMSELQSLIDERVKEPAIDATTFPETPSEGFWAGTPLAGMAPYRWFVSFDRGIAYNALPEHLYNVRCVR